MIDNLSFGNPSLMPTDVTEWLRIHGWMRTASLGDIAERWQSNAVGVLVPMLPTSPDFTLRWDEMLERLASNFDTDPAGILLAIAKSGSDIAEFKAAGQIDDSIPLGDASTLIESVRRAMQASANSALQPRSYYGHSLPDAARDHARNVRLGQTRRGSYIVPVISRLPVLQPEEAEDSVLFEEIAYQPFARTAMLTLASGLTALRDLTHGTTAPAGSRITEAVGVGVSSELCAAVASTLDTDSISELQVRFDWADRLPSSSTPEPIRLERASVPLVRHVGNILRGESVVGRQTLVGYVKRLDRGEDDEVGRITLRILDNDKARNVLMELNDDDYQIAGQANAERRMVTATGILHREPGRALQFTSVQQFHLLEAIPGIA